MKTPKPAPKKAPTKPVPRMTASVPTKSKIVAALSKMIKKG